MKFGATILSGWLEEDSLKTVAMDELVVRSYRIVVAITRVSGGGILGSDCLKFGMGGRLVSSSIQL